jgi:phospholipid/cholesterol/gamma-HCH transport system permease protein
VIRTGVPDAPQEIEEAEARPPAGETPAEAAPAATPPSPAEPTLLDRALHALALALLRPFAEIGMLTRMLGEALTWALRPPYRWRLFVDAMEFIGVGSIFIVTLTAFFVGAVLGLQLVDAFRDFGAESQTGAVVGLGMAREIGPVFTALMVSSRAGSAMTAQLGSMRVSNQIDALVTMAVSPVQYLVVPRLLAGLLVLPLLDVLFNIVGMTGAYLVSVRLLGIDGGVFLEHMKWLVNWDDVAQGLLKAAVFGATVSLIACRQGFYATGGAAGVGQATNRAVVHSAIAILALDYLITSLLLGQGLF